MAFLQNNKTFCSISLQIWKGIYIFAHTKFKLDMFNHYFCSLRDRLLSPPGNPIVMNPNHIGF